MERIRQIYTEASRTAAVPLIVRAKSQVSSLPLSTTTIVIYFDTSHYREDKKYGYAFKFRAKLFDSSASRKRKRGRRRRRRSLRFDVEKDRAATSAKLIKEHERKDTRIKYITREIHKMHHLLQYYTNFKQFSTLLFI